MFTVNCPACRQPQDFSRMPDAPIYVVACSSCLTPFFLKCEDGTGYTAETTPDAKNVREETHNDPFATLLLRNARVVLRNLPVFPAVPQRVLGIIHDPLTSMNDVAAAINQDPALAIKVLRMANSAAFAGTDETKNVQQACTRLGARRLAHLVTSIAAQGVFRCPDLRWRELVADHWAHACATASCAQKLINLVEKDLQDALFLGGLLHDIGKMVLLNLIATKQVQGFDRARQDPEFLNAVLNRFHTLVGLHVVMYWGLPSEVRCSTYFHHCVEHVPDERLVHFTSAIAFSNAFAHKLGYAPDPMDAAESLANAAEFLGIGDRRLAELEAELKIEIPTTISAMALE